MNAFVKVYPNFLEDDVYAEFASALKGVEADICVSDDKAYELETIMRKRDTKSLPPQYSFYEGYLRSVLKSECNMFFQDIIFLCSNDNGIPSHVDSQLKDRLESVNCLITYEPICVNVFYVNVPDDIEGGELVIGNTRITPANNTLVEFSSHLPHYVTGFTTSTRRCMVVTEQCAFKTSDLVLHGSRIEAPFASNEIKKDRYGNFE